MMLLVDIGNSRVKWAIAGRGQLGAQHAASHAGWTIEDWRRSLFGVPGIDRVVASSVAGGPSAAALNEAARLETGRPATFVATSPEAAGVRNAYPDPGLLGIDRWLAVIAAHRIARGACCVADIGTAATLDGVARDGQHLGGFIVPGPDLMMRSLWGGTADLASHTAASSAPGQALFADNTRDAIERGCRLAVAALVDRGVTDMTRRLGMRPMLLLTGGAAPTIESLLETPCEAVPDLVLRGLAILAEAAAGGPTCAGTGGTGHGKPQSN
jgi:type III pantothenate kinase